MKVEILFTCDDKILIDFVDTEIKRVSEISPVDEDTEVGVVNDRETRADSNHSDQHHLEIVLLYYQQLTSSIIMILTTEQAVVMFMVEMLTSRQSEPN